MTRLQHTATMRAYDAAEKHKGAPALVGASNGEDTAEKEEKRAVAEEAFALLSAIARRCGVISTIRVTLLQCVWEGNATISRPPLFVTTASRQRPQGPHPGGDQATVRMGLEISIVGRGEGRDTWFRSTMDAPARDRGAGRKRKK